MKSNKKIFRKKSKVDASSKSLSLSKSANSFTNNEIATASFFSPTSSFIHSIGTTGHPLPSSTQQFFKARIGYDFSHVKIHTGKDAETSANEINAKAYATGEHIAFNKGEYNPDSFEGKKLLAHELMHVIQNAELSNSNKVIQRQERERRIRPVEREALIEQLMQPESPLWRQLNPDADSPINCPATAAAVYAYLRTGRITPAPGGDDLSTFEITASSRMSARINSFNIIRRRLSARNSFAVIRATRGAAFLSVNPDITSEHFFTAVNYRGNIVLIDAYGTGRVILDVNSYLIAEGFEYYNMYPGEFRVIHHGFDEPLIP